MAVAFELLDIRVMEQTLYVGRPATIESSDRIPRLHIVIKVLTEAWRDESGQDLVEYAVVLALIALGAVAAMSSVATAIGAAFARVDGHLTTYTS